MGTPPTAPQIQRHECRTAESAHVASLRCSIVLREHCQGEGRGWRCWREWRGQWDRWGCRHCGKGREERRERNEKGKGGGEFFFYWCLWISKAGSRRCAVGDAASKSGLWGLFKTNFVVNVQMGDRRYTASNPDSSCLSASFEHFTVNTNPSRHRWAG